MRTSDGGVVRINQMRRIGYFGANSVYMSFFGTESIHHGLLGRRFEFLSLSLPDKMFRQQL